MSSANLTQAIVVDRFRSGTLSADPKGSRLVIGCNR